MKRVILFGAGDFCNRILSELFDTDCRLYKDRNHPFQYRYLMHEHILAIADNNWNNKPEIIWNIPIISPEMILGYEYDDIIITLDENMPGAERYILEIYKQLGSMGIDLEKVHLHNFFEFCDNRLIRNAFCIDYSKIVYKQNIQGAIAECGVFRGGFSSIINKAFYDRKLYLFDTFDGFCERDIIEESDITRLWLDNGNEHYFKNSSEQLLRLRCYHRKNLQIVKGMIPETFNKIDDNERFCFVNLDMDLFRPQLEALRYFSTRMSSGGVIVLHDYYAKEIPGTEKAVEVLSKERDITILPIGDSYSVAVVVH